MTPLVLMPSGPFLLNDRFEKALEVTAKENSSRAIRKLLRAAAGDPPEEGAEYTSDGRLIRDANTNEIIAVAILPGLAGERLAHAIARRATSRTSHLA